MPAFSALHTAHGRGAAHVAGGAVDENGSSSGLRESIAYTPAEMTESGRVIFMRCVVTPLGAYVPVSWKACLPLVATKFAAWAGPPTWVMAVAPPEQKKLPPRAGAGGMTGTAPATAGGGGGAGD